MGIIIQTVPVWGTASVVRARKLDPDSRSSRVVYRCADIGEWLDAEAPIPGGRAFENPTGQGRADCGAYSGPGCSTPNG